MSDQLTDAQIEQIKGAVASGRKIEAIKVYREATGSGLKDAKDFIEALTPRLQDPDDEETGEPSGSGGKGCASVVVVCVGLAAAFVWLWTSMA